MATVTSWRRKQLSPGSGWGQNILFGGYSPKSWPVQ